MKLSFKKVLPACLALGALLAGTVQGLAQVQVFVDPSKGWGGFMNVFSLPADGGGYQFGSGWGASDLRAGFAGDLLTLQPCTNVSNPTDTYWTKADGSGNKQMQANWYVDTATLVGSNVTFSGNVVVDALTTNYLCQAFIKVFNGNYSATLQSALVSLTNSDSYFTLNLVATNAGAAHVQYGFILTGPNAPWTNSPDSTCYITIRTNGYDPLNALVNPGFEAGLANWVSYGNGGNIETRALTYYNNNNPVGASNVLVYEGVNVQKVFPTFTGGPNYSGVYQDVPTGPGSTWSATAKFLTHQQDQIGVWQGTGTNQCWLEVTFRDSSDNIQGGPYTSPIIDNSTVSNVWLDMLVSNNVNGGYVLTAPPGTTKVRLQEVYYQPYGYAGGSVYADKFVLDNLSPSDPNLTTLPVSITRLVGDTATFTVVASGQSTLSYQWSTNGVPLVNGGGISGATSATLTITNVQKSQAGTYMVTVTDNAGSLSASATLTVKTPAEAANALDNPSFESGSYAPWATFNGANLHANGDFWDGINITNYDGNYGSTVDNGGEYNGIYQDVPASPGQVFTADAWFYEPSTFPLTENNQCWLEVQFKNGGTPLALYKSSTLGTNDPARPLDTWYDLFATNGFAGDFVTPTTNTLYLVAPAGTTTIRYQITYHVLGGSGGVANDMMSLMKKPRANLTSHVSGGNLNISWLSQGGTSYQVVYKNNITDSTWTPIGGLVAGDGTTKTVSFPTGAGNRFYSVLTK